MAEEKPEPTGQIEFPELQTHRKEFERGMLALAIACAVVVLVIILFTGLGTEFRPKV